MTLQPIKVTKQSTLLLLTVVTTRRRRKEDRLWTTAGVYDEIVGAVDVRCSQCAGMQYGMHVFNLLCRNTLCVQSMLLFICLFLVLERVLITQKQSVTACVHNFRVLQI